MKQKLLYLLILFPILLTSLALYHYKVEPFESFSLRFNDIDFDLQKKSPDKRIVFVAVDEQSVNEYGRWPWDREILAKGISKLNQADVVLMDMIFSEPTEKQKDRALADSLSGLKSSVCGFFLRHNATQKITPDQENVLGDSSLDLLQSQIASFGDPKFISADNAEMNILPILQSCSMSGSFSTLRESDHLLRSYPVAVYFDNMLFPSLAVQGLRLILNKDIKRIDSRHVSIGEYRVNINEKGFVRLNFYQPKQYKIISFLDLVQGKVKPDYFKNKIVILGITEVGAGDIAATPMGALYGPLLHYTFLSNLLSHHLITEPPYITSVLIVIMVLLPFILLLFVKKVVNRVVLDIVGYLLVYLFVRYIFVFYNIYSDAFYPLVAFILSTVSVEVMAFTIQEKGSRFIRNAFSSYLSADLLDKLIKNPEALSLGGEKKELSILFSDIRGFTTISESMDPVSLIKLLNRYFTPMTDAVLQNGGMLDKYIGDAVMAFFNAPVDVPDHANASCRAALQMIEELDKLNKELSLEGIDPIRIGIGINTDEVVVGNMGSNTRFNYTVIGDGVNLASRVEGITKNYAVNILITEFTLKRLKEGFLTRVIEPVKVKGKDEAVLLYELMSNSDRNVNIKKDYDRALDLYKNSKFEEAIVIFENLIGEYDDSVSKYFLPLVRERHPWGVHKMTTK
ncbi:adenylate/guanylate cyclase domain-containing protein [Sulfurimonas sp. HSL-1716]|uniref:adenylate/guanylate cyclase domain-containing protein n=1 Tax=Hydrocurvibacter sulfurireducens TaxID=3131937 RepID=UPI0031F7738E